MAKKNFSRRAEILKRALVCIDRGGFTDFGRFMVLGNVDVSWTGEKEGPEEVHLHLEDDVPKTEESKVWEEINEMFSQLSADSDRVYQARASRTVKERTSLVNPNDPTVGALKDQYFERFRAAAKNLSPEARVELCKIHKELLEETEKQAQENPELYAAQQERSVTDARSDLLDLYYSRQVLARLEKIVRRASFLDPVETDKNPSESVEEYFAEAHQCFLYGFPIATAVLCRAMLASRLEELRYRLDPDRKLKQEVEKAPPGKRPSEYKLLIKRAAEEGLLEDSRPLGSRPNSPHWAEEIIDAGNWAIHKLDKFNKIYGGDSGASKVSELLTITRKAMIQLLTKQQG